MNSIKKKGMAKKMVTQPKLIGLERPLPKEEIGAITKGLWVRIHWVDINPQWVVALNTPDRNGYFEAVKEGFNTIMVCVDQVGKIGPMATLVPPNIGPVGGEPEMNPKKGEILYTSGGSPLTVKEVTKFGVYDQNEDYRPYEILFRLPKGKNQLVKKVDEKFEEWKKAKKELQEALIPCNPIEL